MVRKIAAAIAVLVVVAVLPFAVAYSTSNCSPPCSCCGDTCACGPCLCDELGCACADGGECVCTSDCCEVGGCPHCASD